ncbi:hypothetical protein [Myxosarcina sp. GI1(2024)]
MKNPVNTIIRGTTLVSLPAILFLAFSPSRATAQAYEASRDDFSDCASGLINSGISGEAAAIACADSLDPEELSACVTNIQNNTEVASEEALLACYRVRRPEELASCVVDINTSLADTEPIIALNNCRRSLLPNRYADCTLGLQGSIPDLSGIEAMETCISAEYFPSEFAPELE